MPDATNLLTVDLEEWFVVDILSDRYTLEEWDKLPSTVTANCRRLLETLRRCNTTATWFVLGWIAHKYPHLIREIFHEGHEIACHSYMHRRVDLMDPTAFRTDTEMAIEAIIKAVGIRPVGYRAPSWSINPGVAWAFEILGELQFEYDSSIFPIKHDIYGIPDGPRQMFKMQLENGHTLWEVPASTCRLLGRNVPIAGGGFFRHAPYWYSRRMIRKLNSEQQPVVVYVHPWELDPEPPRIGGLSFLQRYRSYGATGIMRLKLERLLREFSFTTISDYLRLQSKRQIGFR
ncbi:MAG TPA: XrtA system polysaccharide deacetylase [Candidatus Deferrimicrobium sp.]|nr:XrtA system polysaccharide deacetylase [Candidatus Deferrimicrobium sp.]